MIGQLSHIRTRRRELRQHTDVLSNFEKWEETCVPSYCHSNWLAAYVSWVRLFAAASLARPFIKKGGQILDFGSAVGELGHLVSEDGAHYVFIEAEEHAADYLQNQIPKAKRETIQSAQQGAYDVVFAVDALEHNENYAELLTELIGKLAPGGVLILSGPTESSLYRLGRRIAGFDGHYHETTIYAIEAAASKLLERVAIRSIPPVAPLFRITAWKRKSN